MTQGARKSCSRKAPPSPPASPVSEASFPVVGIGASAGGLEALEQFLDHTPADTGMAFVVVQHLDPSQEAPRRTP